jgi:hypothetical protein
MATPGIGLGNIVPDLRNVGPGGWSAALKYYGFAAFFGTMQAATLAINALKRSVVETTTMHHVLTPGINCFHTSHPLMMLEP